MTGLAESLAQKKLIVLDGAMGTELAARGALQSPASNLDFPEVVRSVHLDYISAGVDAIITNTLTANRMSLAHAGLADKVADINRRGAELALEAAAGRCYVLGDVSTCAKLLEPLGECSEAQACDNAAEQALLLSGSGVQGIIVETMTDLREACIAVKAAHESTRLPTIATISFDPGRHGFRTMMGDTPEAAVKGLLAAGASVVGCNCGTTTLDDIVTLVQEMRSCTEAPIAAQPNADRPEHCGGLTELSLNPAQFAEGVLACVEAGASMVGGCCGTTPAHMAEAVRILRHRRK